MKFQVVTFDFNVGGESISAQAWKSKRGKTTCIEKVPTVIKDLFPTTSG